MVSKHNKIFVGVFSFVVLALMLFSSAISVHAWQLQDYPNIFLKGNTMSVRIILGRNALVYDGIASSIILASLQKYCDAHHYTLVYSIVLDTYVDDPYSMNSIVIGGPCANSASSQLFNYPLTCSAGFVPGVGQIRAFDDYSAGKVLFIGGYYWQDTLRAAEVLSKWRDYHINGTLVDVNVAQMPTLLIQ